MPTTIDALPTVPSASAPSTFAATMDAFLAALPTFRTQINTVASEVQGYAAAAFAATTGISTAVAAGTVDAITANFSPDIALTNGQLCAIVSAGSNLSTTPTFTPDGLTTHTITFVGGAALLPGSIGPQGTIHILQYVSTSTRWELLDPMSTGQRVLLATNTLSASASSAFTSSIDATYKRYDIDLIGVYLGAGGYLEWNVSTDAGSTWKTGGTDYAWRREDYTSANSTAATPTGSTGAATVRMHDSSGIDTAAHQVEGRITLLNPASGAAVTKILWDLSYYNGTDVHRNLGHGAYIGGVGAVNGFKITPSASTLNGVMRLYGVQ